MGKYCSHLLHSKHFVLQARLLPFSSGESGPNKSLVAGVGLLVTWYAIIKYNYHVHFHFPVSNYNSCVHTCIPTPATKFLVWDRKIHSLDQTLALPNKKGTSLAYRLINTSLEYFIGLFSTLYIYIVKTMQITKLTYPHIRSMLLSL